MRQKSSRGGRRETHQRPGMPATKKTSERQEQNQLAPLSLRDVNLHVNPPVVRLSNHAFDVLLLLNEALGDMPRELYSAQLASITARTSDIIFEVLQLAEDIAALVGSEAAA